MEHASLVSDHRIVITTKASKTKKSSVNNVCD